MILLMISTNWITNKLINKQTILIDISKQALYN